MATVPASKITVEAVAGIPENSIPDDVFYARLGCLGCSAGLCLRAKGVELSPIRAGGLDADTVALIDTISNVRIHTLARGRNASSLTRAPHTCMPETGLCFVEGDIRAAVTDINERFNTNLSTTNKGQ